jgi:DNA-binding MarR family transcriptional regulator
MKTEASRKKLEEMASEIFELTMLSTLARARARTADHQAEAQLTETEFLTLDVLAKHGPMTVGEIQKTIGVLPAQMSRVIRALEGKSGGAFVDCSINPDDRRRVDVSLTAAGQTAHTAYRNARLAMTMQILSGLSPDDRDEFIRILRTIRGHIDKRLQGS